MKKSINIKPDGIFEIFPSLGTEDANKKLEELQEKDEIAKKVSWEFLSEDRKSVV